MILFHHRAENWLPGLDLHPHSRLQRALSCSWTTRQKRMVEPEVVATSPCRIKSPVPVCCGIGSKKIGGRERVCTQGSQTLDLWGLLIPA